MESKHRDALADSVHELAVALESTTPLGRDIGLCLARFHGAVCSSAACGCSMGVVACTACREPVCVAHLRTCGMCKVFVCPTCASGKHPMILVPYILGAIPSVWICEAHFVLCAPVCATSMSCMALDRCAACRRKVCTHHRFDGKLTCQTSAWGWALICSECLRSCVECHVPLHRRHWIDPTTPAYKASTCHTCYHGPDVPLMKRHKIE